MEPENDQKPKIFKNSRIPSILLKFFFVAYLSSFQPNFSAVYPATAMDPATAAITLGNGKLKAFKLFKFVIVSFKFVPLGFKFVPLRK